jgi:hypothetical protein
VNPHLQRAAEPALDPFQARVLSHEVDGVIQVFTKRAQPHPDALPFEFRHDEVIRKRVEAHVDLAHNEDLRSWLPDGGEGVRRAESSGLMPNKRPLQALQRLPPPAVQRGGGAQTQEFAEMAPVGARPPRPGPGWPHLDSAASRDPGPEVRPG